jgi:hypothetical protein
MEDEKLLKVSLITVAFGMTALFIIMQVYPEKTYSLKEIENLSESEKVVVYGYVNRIVEADKYALFEISQIDILNKEAIYFKRRDESVKAEENSSVRIKGTIYQGKILVNEIEELG